MTFTGHGDGTATLAGTPQAGAGGAYSLAIGASNGTPPNAAQTLALTVNEAPSLTSANATVFTTGSAGSFTVTTGHAYPAAITLAQTGALPQGVSFTDLGDGTATLAGTPASGTAGSYPLTLGASNGISPNASQAFGLTVNDPPPGSPGSVSATDDLTTKVRLTWTASPGATVYDVYRHTTSTFASAVKQGESTGLSYDDTTAVTGTTYAYWVQARNAYGSSAPAGPDQGTRIPLPAVTSVGLSASPAAGRAIGLAVALTATPVGGSNPECKFWILDPDTSSWQTLRDWGASTLNWTPSRAGWANLQVWSRSTGSTTPTEATAELNYRVSAAVSSVSLAASPSAGQVVGQPVALTATAVGGTQVEYKFWSFDTGTNSWQPLRDWGVSTLSWTPSRPGWTSLQVWARSAGSTQPSEAHAELSYRANAAAVSSVSLSASPSAGQAVGQSVALTAAAVGGSSPEYKFWIYDADASSWQPLRDWGASTLSWTPSRAGWTALQVWARSAGSAQPSEAHTEISYRVTAAVSSVTLTASPASGQTVGQPAALTAAAVGGSNPEYKFWIHDSETSTWQPLRDWGASTLSWTPSRVGWNALQVWARSGGSSQPSQAHAELSYRVTAAAVSSVTLSASPANGQVVGQPVALTATPVGSPAECKFWSWDRDTSSWQVLRDWGASTLNWTPSHEGWANLQVWARSSGSTNPSEANASINYRVHASAASLLTLPADQVSQTSAAHSTATVPRGIAGVATMITVQAKDAQGQNHPTGGDTVVITIHGANTARPAVTDRGDGSYTASYTPTVAGTDDVSIGINGQLLERSPYQVLVQPGAVDPARSTVTLAPDRAAADGVAAIVATAMIRDAYDNPLAGVPAWQFAVASAPGGASVTGPAAETDAGGQATFRVTSTTPGSYALTVRVFDVTLDARPTALFRSLFRATIPAGLAFVGLPFVPDDPRPEALFGPDLAGRLAAWRCSPGEFVRYQAGTAEPLFDLTAGQGFWSNLAAPVTIDAAGAPTPDGPFRFALQPGFNALGNPFDERLRWDPQTIQVFRDGVLLGNLSQAELWGLVRPYAWIWDPAARGHWLVMFGLGRPDVPRLAGFWVEALSPGVSLVVPRSPAGVSRSQPIAAQRWMTTVIAQTTDASSTMTVGVDPALSRSLAIASPPEPEGGAALQLAVVGADGLLAGELRTAGREQSWELQLSSAIDGEATLSWPSLLRDLPRGLLVELQDPGSGQRWLLNTSASVRLPVTRGSQRRLRLTARFGNLQRATITGLQLHGSRGAGQTVALNLTGPARVTLLIKGLTGRLVRQVTAEATAAGPLQIAWDGQDQYGRPVPRGSYLLEAVAESDNGATMRVTRTVSVE